jgi:cysteine/O-acetylserine efflux protein
MGVLYGYKRTLKYLIGIASGFFLVMLLCGLISTRLLTIFPTFERILRIIGAFYILWLAVATLRESYSFTEKEQPLMGFIHGMSLQILNAKMIIYGMTIYSTFLSSYANQFQFLILSAVGLAGLAFISVSVWALFGSLIRSYLVVKKVKLIVNIILACMLAYSALQLSGLLTG